tara:strand:+ start:199 stop:678 length:480 start_codon:yes stop_codon:yes gene_type:complete
MSMIPALMGGRKLSHSLDFDSTSAASALLRLGVQTIDMAGATTTLVTKQTSTSGEVQLKGQIINIDANLTGGGTSVQELRLPPEEDSEGLFLIMYNFGGEQITIKDDAGSTTVAVIDSVGASTGEFVLLWCDGTATSGDTEGDDGDSGWRGNVFPHDKA